MKVRLRSSVIAAVVAFAVLAVAVVLAMGHMEPFNHGGGTEVVPAAEPVPAVEPVPATEPNPGPDAETYPEPAPGTQPSPLYVHVRTSVTDDGGIMWHFIFSNHGDRSISQIIIAWAAYDEQGKLLDNPTTSFNLFEKGWNITGNPLAPGHALDEVTVGEIVFTNPDYHSTTLMMVAITFADGAHEQLILDGTYKDVSNIPTDLGDVTPGL